MGRYEPQAGIAEWGFTLEGLVFAAQMQSRYLDVHCDLLERPRGGGAMLWLLSRGETERLVQALAGTDDVALRVLREQWEAALASWRLFDAQEGEQ